jgi:hypothetical protein
MDDDGMKVVVGEVVDERAQMGESFLLRVYKGWEGEALDCDD